MSPFSDFEVADVSHSKQCIRADKQNEAWQKDKEKKEAVDLGSGSRARSDGEATLDSRNPAMPAVCLPFPSAPAAASLPTVPSASASHSGWGCLLFTLS